MVARQGLQSPDDLPDFQSRPELKQEMQVVRHDGGGEEFDVFSSMEIIQCIGYDLARLWFD